MCDDYFCLAWFVLVLLILNRGVWGFRAQPLIAFVLTVGVLAFSRLVGIVVAIGASTAPPMSSQGKSSDQLAIEAATSVAIVGLSAVWIPWIIALLIRHFRRKREALPASRGFSVIVPGFPAEKIPPGLDPDAVLTPKALRAKEKRVKSAPPPSPDLSDPPNDPAPPSS